MSVHPPRRAHSAAAASGAWRAAASLHASAMRGLLFVGMGLASVLALTGRAHAYGAVYSSKGEPALEQTAARVLLVDKPGRNVAAVVQLEVAGPPQPFVWLLPVPAGHSVQVSSSTVLQRLATTTTPEYWVERVTGDSCAPPGDGGAGEYDPDSDDPYGDTAGPYEAPAASGKATFLVQSHELVELDATQADPTQALVDWLRREGYDTSAFERKAWRPYLEDGLQVLAVRYESGEPQGATQPLVLHYRSRPPTLPWRPTVASARDRMPVSVWVLGASQAVPANYPSLVLNDALINWHQGQSYVAGTLPAAGSGPFYGVHYEPPANYADVIAAAIAEAEDGGFVTEVAIPASALRGLIWSNLDDESYMAVRGQEHEDGLDVVLALQPTFGGWDGWRTAIGAATTLPEGVTLEEFEADPESYRGEVTVDTETLWNLVDELTVDPVRETADLLYEAPYLTRFATTLGKAGAKRDPTFGFNSELALNRGVHFARRYADCASGQNASDAPWQFDLPQGGLIVGEGTQWPIPIDSMPATLKVVELSSEGSGKVVTDHSTQIAEALFEASGAQGSGVAMPSLPSDGLLIGATQSVLPEPEFDTDASEERTGGAGCNAAPTGSGPAVWQWLWLLALLRLARGAGHGPRTAAARSLLCLGLVGCGTGGEDGPPRPPVDAGPAGVLGALTREELRDPKTCKTCHPKHYEEWSASMHAYAAKDPVFLAMNRRGQRETKGELGDLCVKCHAPMAVEDGLTKDGLNLEKLADLDRGVSCYYCHNVVGVEDDHNGKLTIADDNTMRGPIEDPLQPAAHRAEYSPILAGRTRESTTMCGGCHDIVMPSGVHLERTFEEYRHGVYSKSAAGEPEPFDSCAGCHMPPSSGVAANVKGAPERTVHEHLWPGVDVALIDDFPHRKAMRSAVEDCQLGIPSVLYFTLEVTPPGLFTFQIETGAGHNQPSGASQDRRMWLEFLAYEADGELIEEASSGLIADDEIADKPFEHPDHDPNLVIFRDYIYKADGDPAHMFWDAAKSAAYPMGFESRVLPGASSTYAEGGHAVVKQYRATSADGSLPARVTARLKMRPIGQDVLQDLVDSGDLDAKIAARMPTFTFGAKIDWTPKDGLRQTIRAEVESDCESYRCLLHPDTAGCE